VQDDDVQACVCGYGARGAGTRRHTYVEVLQQGSSARTAAEGAAPMRANHDPCGGRDGKYGAASRKEKLRSDTRQSRRKQHDMGSARSARPAAVVDRSGWRHSRWKGRPSYRTRRSERN
jgi:hypothetical protein